MPGFKNYVTGDPILETELDDFIGAQINMRYPDAATRDADAVLTAALREGMVCYLVDTDVLAYYDGSAWVEFHRGTARLSHDPILNQSANVTYTKNRTHYRKRGRDVEFGFNLTATSAGTAATDISIELPFAAPAAAVGDIIGTGFILDLSVNILYCAQLIVTSTTYAKFIPLPPAGPLVYLGSSLTLASGDVVRGSGHYEAAA